ncbi:MAG: GDSL-type esterase/lipase family protein, partial [Methylococcales bacterium]
MMKFLFMVSVGLISMTVNAKTVVVLGDSISAGYGINVNAGWVSLLEKKLNKNGAHHVVHNESISGDTTAGGLA